MSPEQARGEKVDHRTDLFSLGSVLYTMCSGWPAFAAESSMATLKRVCDESPRPIRDINRDIPKWFAAIVDKMLAKDRGQRYQTATEVAKLLGEHLARLNYSGPVQPTATHKPVKRSAKRSWSRQVRLSSRDWRRCWLSLFSSEVRGKTKARGQLPKRGPARRPRAAMVPPWPTTRSSNPSSRQRTRVC